MKTQMLLGFALFTVLTAVDSIWAQENSAEIRTRLDDGAPPSRLTDYDIHLNPQLGLSSFEYSGRSTGSSKQQLSGGLTAEFGGPARKLETGVVIMRTGSAVEGEDITSTYLALPMMAKIRVVSLRAQSWYTKFGFMSAFELNSSRDSVTNNFDVIGSLGVGGRLPLNRTMDVLVDASYNRGLLDALRTQGENYNQGFLFLAGVSIRI
ncbi:MAG: hypothetical protein AB7G93_04980 [Bdellovibrionales bacterium]